MLTTKNRFGLGPTGVLIVSIAGFVSGCTPAGPKALLDGERLLNRGQVEPAVQRLERAVRLIPEDPRAWNYLGLAYHRAGRLDSAAQAYGQALILDVDHAPARFNLGCVDLERGDADGAIRELTAYLALQPGSIAGWLKLGTAQLRVRQTEGAEQSFRQALELEERLPEGLNGLGLVQVQRRRYPEAYQQFQAAIRLQPDYAPAVRNAAVVAHEYLRNPSVALQRYRDLLALPNVSDKEDVQLLVARIEEDLKPVPKPPAPPPEVAEGGKLVPTTAGGTKPVERPPRAAPPATRIARVDPPESSRKPPAVSSAASNTASGAANPLRPGNGPKPAQTPDSPPQSAQTDQPLPVVSEPVVDELSPFPRYRYRALSKPKPGDRAAAQRSFAEGFRAHSRYRFSDAIAAYQHAIQSDPAFFDAYYNLGVAAYESGDLPLSLSAYESALALEPESLKARFNFASTLEQAGYLQDAADELEKLVSQHPDEVRVHAALANLYARKLGDPKRARVHYLRVLELDPRYPEATAIRYWLEAHP